MQRTLNYTYLTLRVGVSLPLPVEHEWTVGPIPFGDGLGREVALR